MKASRLSEIENLLEEKQTISINDLCDIFQVSKNTIRRDIVELQNRGLIKKVYGGIMRNTVYAPEPFATREIKNKTKKKIIAKLAAQLVSDDDIIYIDSGTTTMHMVPYLANRKNLTIITSNVYVINEAFQYPQIEVIATGGNFYRPSNAFTGVSVTEFLAKYNIAKCFFASTGFSIGSGITNTTPLEGDIKTYLSQNSKTKILLADSTKVDKISLITYAPLESMDYIVCDSPLPEKYNKFCKEHNIKLITP